MWSTFIQRLFVSGPVPGAFARRVFDRSRPSWDRLVHLLHMDSERFSGLGLEPMLTTSELAEYLGVNVQAIYDLRADGRGPTGVRVGRELRFPVSDVRGWLDRLHEPDQAAATVSGGDF